MPQALIASPGPCLLPRCLASQLSCLCAVIKLPVRLVAAMLME